MLPLILVAPALRIRHNNCRRAYNGHLRITNATGMAVGPSNYYFNVSGEEAESLLKTHGKMGSFLARPSTKLGDFTISVRRDNDHVTHVRISCTDDGLHFTNGGEVFPTLTELVRYYLDKNDTLKEKNGNVIQLLYPLTTASIDSALPPPTRAKVAPSLNKQPWYHGNMDIKRAEDLLNSQGAEGSFIVRDSTSTPGQFAITVRLHDRHMKHVKIVHTAAGYDVEDGNNPFPTLQAFKDHYQSTPLIDAQGDVLQLKEAVTCTRMEAMSICERVYEHDRDASTSCSWDMADECVTRINAEYDSLEATQHSTTLFYSRKEGRRPGNVVRNRYRNIVPYDHTRVVVRPDPAQHQSRLHTFVENVKGHGSKSQAEAQNDYINANYIEVLEGDYPELAAVTDMTYISTQAPLSQYIDDFWRMIWQEKCTVIVMLTQEVEHGRPKCARYWPSECNSTISHASHIKVTMKEESVFAEMWSTSGGADCKTRRAITHFQYTGWPDHGYPDHPGDVITFLDKINTAMRASATPKLPEDSARSTNEERMPPAVVHCSAGIGRTGTLIAINMILETIKIKGLQCDVDIARTVQMLREQRAGMVQTQQQYLFIFKAVAHFVDMECRRLNITSGLTSNKHEYSNVMMEARARTPTEENPVLSYIRDDDNPLPTLLSKSPKSTANTQIIGFDVGRVAALMARDDDAEGEEEAAGSNPIKLSQPPLPKRSPKNNV